MEFEKQIPEWVNEGDEPSETLKTNGFVAGNKPPANIFNWLFNLVFSAIKEIQSKLSKVDNTADSEKAVAFASEAGVGRKVKYPFTLRFKGGSTEGTDLWTYDGSTSRSVNITPEKIGAVNTDLSNVDDSKFKEKVESLATKGIPIVNATSTDGETYYADISDYYEDVYNGLQFVIIPQMASSTTNPRLMITTKNAVHNRSLVLATTQNTRLYDSPANIDFIGTNAPILITLSTDRAIMTGYQSIRASNIKGTVPLENGGTGATTGEQALINLGGAKKDLSNVSETAAEKFATDHGICRIQKANLPEGNDLFGKDNPSSFTFDFPPKVVICSDEEHKAIFIPFDDNYVIVDARDSGGEIYSITANLNGNTLQWYATSSDEQFTTSWRSKTIIGLG